MANSRATPRLFLHAEFEVPNPASPGNEKSSTVVKHHFESADYKPALIGLEGEPIKPKPGDFTYSGMHDHGPLPRPKEGGVFASLIGLCQEAKKSSDKYLTDIIENEKQNDK